MLISCLMPTKNRRRFIAGSVAMFQAQIAPLDELELIVVEDGDEDCSDLLAEEPRARYFRFVGNIGETRNYAVRQARGEICMNWDDDDWYGPTRVSTQLQHMFLSARAVVGLSSAIYYREGDSIGYEYTGDAWYISGFSQCFRRDFALAHPYPDVAISEDLLFVRKARELGELSSISGLTCLVARNHEHNTSPRAFWDPAMREILLATDNWREVPLKRFAATVFKIQPVMLG